MERAVALYDKRRIDLSAVLWASNLMLHPLLWKAHLATASGPSFFRVTKGSPTEKGWSQVAYGIGHSHKGTSKNRPFP